LSLTLRAVYINHNLRPDEVPGEIACCENLCGRLGVPLAIKSVDVSAHAATGKMNIHEAARELRYRAFEEAAFETAADRIALGHNADDQVETFFLRFLRGAGPRGLAGIPPVRGKIIRPLIEAGRKEIESYLEAEGISPVTDSSNLKSDYFRNRLRQQLMPAVRDLAPDALPAMLHTMAVLREEERYFEIIVTKTLMKMISRKTDRRIELFLSPMETLDLVVLRRVLRRAIDETAGLRGIGFTHIEDVIRLVRKGSSGDRIYLPHGMRVIREYALLVMTSEQPVELLPREMAGPGDLPLREAGLVLRVSVDEKPGDPVDGRWTVVLDADKVRFPLRVRHRQSGDFFFPIGFGQRKKLQDYFVDEKVPRDERDGVPVVTSGEDIVWVAGYRADDRFKVSADTSKFLRLGIVRGNF
jgi:tRNA(Ile)-lysidine synthase